MMQPHKGILCNYKIEEELYLCWSGTFFMTHWEVKNQVSELCYNKLPFKKNIYIFKYIKINHIYMCVFVLYMYKLVLGGNKRNSSFGKRNWDSEREVSVCTFFFKDLFMGFCLCWVFVAARWLSIVAASGGYILLQCTGFSLRCFSCCKAQALEHRLSSCGSWAWLLRSMWDLPGPTGESNQCPLHYKADS